MKVRTLPRIAIVFFITVSGPFLAAAELKQVHVRVPGDDALGFFARPGYCRLRAKLQCRLPLTIKDLPNQVVDLKLKKGFLRTRSGEEGVFDLKFPCPKSLARETVKIVTGKYEKAFKLSEAPKEFAIPDRVCGAEFPF